MQRKEAEKLLAALIFDDLDEASKKELLNYLQTDNELRERLADMRMAVKVTSDTVQHGPDPVLGKRRLKRLARLARHHHTWTMFFTVPRLSAAAAIFIVAALVISSIQSVSSFSKARVASTKANERLPAYKLSLSAGAPESTPSDSESRRTHEITSTTGQYAFDPAVRGPEAVDRTILGLPVTITNGAFKDDNRNFIVNNSEKIGGEQTSITGYANLPAKPDSIEEWTSTSSWDHKPHSGVTIGGGDGSYDVGEYRPWWAGDHGAGYGDKNGDGVMSYPYPATGYGGMGGYGGGGMGISGGGIGGYGGGVYGYSGPGGKAGKGGGGSGIMAPSPPGSRYGYTGMGGYAGGGLSSNYDDRSGYFSRGVDSGNGVDRSIDFSVGKKLNGVISGDTLVGTGGTATGGSTYEGDIKEIKLFSGSPDAPGVVADSIAEDGRFTLQNGQAVVTSTDGSTVNITDTRFDVVSNGGAPRPVTVVVGKPIAITGPELTTPPPPTRPSQTIKGVTGISEMPGLKLKTDSGESRLEAEDIKTPSKWAEMRADAYDEVLRKKSEELAMKSHRLAPKKVEPPLPDYGMVMQGGREGDVSRETDEASIPYSAVISSADTEKYIADLLGSKDKTKALPGTTRRADESSAPAEGPADKKEGKRIPILGDIPILGHLYNDADMKRPLTEEEKKQIIAHLAQRKSQPQGETAGLDYETVKLNYLDPRMVDDSTEDGFRDLPGTEFLPGVAIELLPQDKKIIIFGSKEQREAVKNMIRAMDVPPGESTVDLGKIPTTGEDEPDLPPASRFKLVPVNPWVMAERDSLSTFALDVDTASYTLCRRYIRGGFLPPAGAVRMEEFVNYFNYHYPQRTNPTFKVHAEAAPSPFARREQNLTLLKIGVKARTIGRDQRKAAHLIFVVDASASMDQPDRLPLVQRALGLLVNRLSAVDRVSLITCANEARLHLETVPARERGRIRQAINAIQPAGPTNLLAGLKLGYATARRTFAPKQINHVVLCSDGVANVGQTEAEAVLNEVDADRKQGITITCVGVGYGSYNDAFLEALANQGDGSYMFLDSLRQVHRVFVRQLAATLQTVAKDARIQVDFNPNRVRRYRLIGYENRDIEDERFRDDTIDAGEVGSGQCSTALYELELIGQPSADRQEDLGTVFVRYRDVETGQFEEISSRLSSAIVRRLTVDSTPRFFLAAGAARFAEILRQSEHAQDGNLMDVFRVIEQVNLALPLDRDVRELAELIRKSENLPRSP